MSIVPYSHPDRQHGKHPDRRDGRDLRPGGEEPQRSNRPADLQLRRPNGRRPERPRASPTNAHASAEPGDEEGLGYDTPRLASSLAGQSMLCSHPVSTLPALVKPLSARMAESIDTTPAVSRRRRGRAPRRRGRPTKLTPELEDQLVATVRQVGFLSTAARSCGVPPSLVCEWVARGLGRDPDSPPTKRFAEFADGVERARGQFELERLARSPRPPRFPRTARLQLGCSNAGARRDTAAAASPRRRPWWPPRR
jgi:hypothetical protein